MVSLGFIQRKAKPVSDRSADALFELSIYTTHMTSTLSRVPCKMKGNNQFDLTKAMLAICCPFLSLTLLPCTGADSGLTSHQHLGETETAHRRCKLLETVSRLDVFQES